MTQNTADAFIITTTNAIAAAQYLFDNHDYQYILPAVFSQDPVEKFFGQAHYIYIYIYKAHFRRHACW